MNETKLKTVLEICNMSEEEMIDYIDYLTSCLKDYQIAFDQMAQKNKNFT